MEESMREAIKELVKNAKTVLVSSVDTTGYPNTKAMLTLEHDGLGIHYFSTNYSAKRTQQFMANPKACIYFYSEARFTGVMLIGEMEVLTDTGNKTRFWREGFEKYYPKGIDDEDYCVFRFRAERGNYYHGLKNHDFLIEEVKQCG